MKSDWLITGAGGQSVINVDASMRCQLSGTKYMLWNARNNLTDCECIATIKPYTNQNSGQQRGGMLLRTDDVIMNYYRLLVYYYTSYRTYYIHRVINGVATLLSQVISYQGYNIHIKTRFRIDGWQLSVEEYLSNEWKLITAIEDTDHTVVSGYVGLCGINANTAYSVLFDDCSISEK